MPTIKEAFAAGKHCGLFGPNIINSNYTFFATKKKTDAWERGVKAGKKIKDKSGVDLDALNSDLKKLILEDEIAKGE